jgi:serine/threonine protein kinase
MLAPNTLLQNRYLIERKLGQGGMGAVYLAVDRRFDTTVALKETLVTDEGLRKAFEREARLLNKLRHAGLPHVMDYFSEGTGEFLVMQYIPGDDLAALLEKNGRPFATDQLVRWADQILAVLEYLHGHEPPIVHRDIKPQNIKLTPSGEVILLDFGLSKGSAADLTQAAGGASIAGYTPHFAPLEQIRGMGTNPRSDLYSVGATFYMLATGRTPADALERATSALGNRPDPLVPISQLNPSVPSSVAQVLEIALGQMPERRWISAAAMRNALRDAASNSNAATAIQRPPATVPVNDATMQLRPPSMSPQTSAPTTPAPAPQPQYQPQQQPPPQQQQNYQTAQGLFNVPGPSVWPNQMPSNPQQQMGMQVPMYASQPGVAAPRKPRTVRWTLFAIWAVIGFFVSLIPGAVLAVAVAGDEPAPQVTLLLTLFVYFVGLVGLFVWAKL